jgi:hypothetical protein
MKKWKFLHSIPQNHKWFECMESGRISCADYSGKYPHQTEDGPLWLNKERPIVISNSDGRITVKAPVIVHRTGQQNHIICGLDEMIYLVQEHDMEVEVRTASKVRLFLGVDQSCRQGKN